MTHELPALGYRYDALEPFIDGKTMEIHHTKHHQGYVDKLNAALDKHPGLKEKPITDLLKNMVTLPDDIRNAVRNNGGGHYNHSFFWPLLKKGTVPTGGLREAIQEEFGSIEGFRKRFSDSAAGIFGSGWQWLVMDATKIELMSTPNQDSPLTVGKIPIIGLDVWEHAYYLKYQNKRADYIEAFWNVLDWNRAEENFAKGRGQRQ